MENNIDNNNVIVQMRNMIGKLGIEGSGENTLKKGTGDERGVHRRVDSYEKFFAQFEEKEIGSEGDDESEDNLDHEEEEEEEDYEGEGLDKREFNRPKDINVFLSTSMHSDNSDTQDSRA